MSGCAYFLDTETTDAEGSEVIQLAIMGPLESVHTDAPTRMLHFKPTKPISIGALATHHIIDSDLAAFPDWNGYTLPIDCGYIVGHSIDFDWKAIGSPNVKRICTLALARSVWPDLDSHKLTALMYHIYPQALARELVKNAHDAAGDVGLCSRLLFAMFDVIDQPENWESLWRTSEDARVPKYMTFGSKYSPHQYPPNGMPIAEMRARDPGYVRWLLANADTVKDDVYWQRALCGQ